MCSAHFSRRAARTKGGERLFSQRFRGRVPVLSSRSSEGGSSSRGSTRLGRYLREPAVKFVEEVICPLAVPEAQVAPATHVRTTLLSTSMTVVRERNLLETYLAKLPRKHHAQMLDLAVGEWLPVELAIDHYAVMNSLPFTPKEQYDLGRTATARHQQGFSGTVLRLGTGAAGSPWVALPHTQRLWDRLIKGGAVRVVKTGPKDARFEGFGCPLARFAYFRNAWRGLTAASLSLFNAQVYVNEIPRLCTLEQIGFQVSWA